MAIQTGHPYLANARATRAVIEKYKFPIQKKYGQNFLIDASVLEGIMDAAEVTKEDFVLEIGPGIGTMTQYLGSRARAVVAVEIDRMLLEILDETLQGFPNVEVLHQDILKTDIAAIAAQYNGGRPVKVVANLPYYITTPIIMELFERSAPVESITVMVQKEVADRMQAGPGTKDYGALSLAVQYYAKPVIKMTVPPSSFMPQPKVESVVIRLQKYEQPPVQARDEKLLFDLIRASFNQRRKTLANGLNNAANLPFTKEQITRAIEALGKSPTVRGEALTLAEFAALSDLLGKIQA